MINNIYFQETNKYGQYKESIVEKEFLDRFISIISNSLVDGWSNRIDEKIIEKLKNLIEIASLAGEKAYNNYVQNVEDFSVIIHGDLWCTNIMFKYDKLGKVEDAKLVSLALILGKIWKILLISL